MVLRISVILFLLAYLKPSKQQEPPFQFKLITPSPDVDINLILVECFEVERGQGNPDAFIWLNGISLATLTRVDRLPQTRRFRFIITRDLEGNYTCGTQEDSVNRLQSKPERLVAFPVLLPDIENTVHRGVSGNEARLPCAIQPGRLVGFYIATWRNATSGEVLVDFRMGMPRTNANFERYSVDPNDLSLIISEVTPADTGEYVCVLGVNGADRADGDMFYEQTHSINITLMVFDPPMISEPPVPQVVTLPENTFNSRNDGTTIFRCTATASTSVAIVWLHDGRDASRLAADDTSRYNTAILDSETDGGITRVTSQLEIESVGVNDNGVVVCEAQVPTSEALEDPVTATAETTLTVLGGFRKITPRVTQDSHVLYDIELFDTIPTEVKLLIEYTPTGGQPTAIPTSEGFVNTTSILFLEREPLSGMEFTVRVALYIQDSGINGPFSDPSQTLDVRNRPLTRDELIATSVTATAGGFLIIVLIFVTVIVILVFVRKHRTRESNLDRTRDTLNQIPMNENESPEERAQTLSRLIPILYKTFKQCDSTGERNMQLVEQLSFTDEEIEEGAEQIKDIVRAGVNNRKMRKKVIEKMKEVADVIQTYDQDFLIKAIKSCRSYSSVYAGSDVLTLPSVNDSEETLDSFVEFIVESLIGLLKKRQDLRVQFKAIVDPPAEIA